NETQGAHEMARIDELTPAFEALAHLFVLIRRQAEGAKLDADARSPELLLLQNRLELDRRVGALAVIPQPHIGDGRGASCLITIRSELAVSTAHWKKTNPDVSKPVR